MYRMKSLFFSQRGQTTAEYALVLLVVGVVVGVFIAFIRSGAMADFFGGIIDRLNSGIDV